MGSPAKKETSTAKLTYFLERNPQLQISVKDLEQLKLAAKTMTISKGNYLMRHGDSCQFLPIVLNGKIKVRKSSEDSREVILYYIYPGESCILSILGILNATDFPAGALGEEDSELLLLPSSFIRDFVNRYQGWRDFVFRMYNNRFHQLIEFIDEIMFRKLDSRLISHLLSISDSIGIIHKTHRQLADDLGTSREVISRILKELEKEGLIELGRGQLRISNEIKMKNHLAL